MNKTYKIVFKHTVDRILLVSFVRESLIDWITESDVLWNH